MPTQCFACDVFTPCFAFAGRLICGDCASDGAVVYRENGRDFALEFAVVDRTLRLFAVETGDQSHLLMGQVVRLHKLKLDQALESIARGEAPLVKREQPRYSGLNDRMEEAA